MASPVTCGQCHYWRRNHAAAPPRCQDEHNDVMFFRATPASFGCLWE